MAIIGGGIQVANLAGMFNEGQQTARDDRKRGALAKFLQPARAGDKDAQTALYGAGAGAEAAEAQTYAGTQQKDAREQFGKASVMFSQLGDTPQGQQYFAEWVKQGKAVGVIPADQSEVYHPDSLKVANATAQAYGGAGAKPAETSDIQNYKYGLTNPGFMDVLTAKNAPKPRFQLYDSADGPVWLPEPTAGGAPQAGPSTAGPSGGASSVLDGAFTGAMPTPETYAGIATEFPGVQLTSTKRTPERNAAVGGKPNSQHLRGTAGDFVVPDAQKPAFMAAMRAKGLHPIDEGDHIHVQQPRGASQPAPGGVSAIPIGGVRPKAKATVRNLTPDEIRQAGYRPGSIVQRGADGSDRVVQAPAQDRSAMSDAERKTVLAAKAKVPQLQNAIRGLGRIDQALAALDGGMVNTGPLDQYAIRNMPSGQELEAAVGGIQNSFLALTRVPGIGSQSDLEARIANLQYPSLDKAPEVNKRTMENLKLFARDLAQAYESAVQGGGGVAPPAEGDDDDALIGKYL